MKNFKLKDSHLELEYYTDFEGDDFISICTGCDEHGSPYESILYLQDVRDLIDWLVKTQEMMEEKVDVEHKD